VCEREKEREGGRERERGGGGGREREREREVWVVFVAGSVPGTRSDVLVVCAVMC
jgi:hypothetical protein